MDPDRAFKIGLYLTLVVILLQVACIIFVMNNTANIKKVTHEQQELHHELVALIPLLEESSFSGDTELSVKKILFLLNSIDGFIRKTPLVECGNWNERRKKTSIPKSPH